MSHSSLSYELPLLDLNEREGGEITLGSLNKLERGTDLHFAPSIFASVRHRQLRCHTLLQGPLQPTSPCPSTAHLERHSATPDKVSLPRVLRLATPAHRPRSLQPQDTSGLRRAINGLPKLVQRDFSIIGANSRGIGGLSPQEKMPRKVSRKAGVYAVAIGFKPGLYETWDEANTQVRGYPGAKHQKFGTRQEATGWLAESGVDLDTSSNAAQGRSCSPEPRPRKRNHGQERVPTTKVRKVTVPNTNTSTQPSLPELQVRDLETDRAAPPFNDVSPSPLSPILADIAQKGFLFSKSSPHHLIVYTDGSARGNGQVGSKAGAGVWWGSQGEASKSNWAERVPGHPQTNNRGELLAVIRAIERCPYPDLPLEVRCDSRYSISCMTIWLPKWVEKGFKSSRGEPVMNVDLIKHLMTVIRRRGPNAPVRFKHVSAHSGIIGNEEADRLAKTGGALPDVKDRGEWLDLDPPEEPQDNKLISVDSEIDERWLMSAEEIDLLERDLAEGDRGVGRDS